MPYIFTLTIETKIHDLKITLNINPDVLYTAVQTKSTPNRLHNVNLQKKFPIHFNDTDIYIKRI